MDYKFSADCLALTMIVNNAPHPICKIFIQFGIQWVSISVSERPAWNRGRVLESPCCTFLFRALPYFSQGGEEALLQRNVLRGAAVDSRGQPEATRGRAESMLWWCRWCRRCRGAVAQGRSNRASKWRQKSHSSWSHLFWKGDLSILWCTGFPSCRVKEEPESVECWPLS